MLTLTLLTTSVALLGAGGVAHLAARITASQYSGVAAAASILAVVAMALDGIVSVAGFFAALGAANALIWWNGEGARRGGARP
jgi:hypothetical protein